MLLEKSELDPGELDYYLNNHDYECYALTAPDWAGGNDSSQVSAPS